MGAGKKTSMDVPLVACKYGFVTTPDMESHVRKLFEGEYEAPSLDDCAQTVILDIGANHGAFAVWALEAKSEAWPNAKVFCYEPVQLNFSILERNARQYSDRMTLTNAGVTSCALNLPDDTCAQYKTIYCGKHNLGECSFYDLREQNLSNTQQVRIIHPARMPKCHIMKIDTEGCELDILQNYLIQYQRALPKIIMLEYHRMADAVAIKNLLVERYAYTEVRRSETWHDRGILVFQLDKGV